MCRSGETQSHERTAAWCLLRGHRPALGLHDLTDDREAEPRAGKRAGVCRAVESVEDSLAVLGGDTRPVIADDKLAMLEDDVDGRSFPAPLARVLEQVPDRTLEPLRISIDDGRLEP